jgi:exopolysaccharide biosynthesis polyprenyl glycosylphosphotransferase
VSSERQTSFVLLLLDLVVAVLVFNVVAHFWGVGSRFLLEPLIWPLFSLVAGIYLIDGYRPRTDMLSLDYASQHTIAVTLALLATLLFTFVFIKNDYALQSSRGVIAFSFIALFPLTLGYRRMIYARAVASRGERSFVFLGDRASYTAFHAECQKMGNKQPIVYAVLNEASVSPFATSEDHSLRLFEEVLAEVQSGKLEVEAIIMRETSRELHLEINQRLLNLFFGGVPTYTLELFHQVHWQKVPLYRLNQMWLFQEGFRIARDPVFERLKRVSDILLSSIGLSLAAPLFAAAALAIWLEDRGPVFFNQVRIGRNRAPFRIVKLRTMRPSAGGDCYTQVGDNRITRVGRFLRATRIDEFPQLWNVLHGEMSLIGPRAEWDRLVEDYERQIPCYYFRHLVKPGITGWAQVNYHYGANVEDTLRKLEYDLYYIRHFSFRLDASIVLKTIHVMIFGKGR